MIKRQTAFVVGDKVFATLKEAQAAVLVSLLASSKLYDSDDEDVKEDFQAIVDYMVENKDLIVDALTTTETSLTAARRVNGGRKQRKPKLAATEKPEPELPLIKA